MHIRIATKAWDVDMAAATMDQAQIGFDVPWVEIDGHRTNQIVSAHMEMLHQGFHTVDVKFIGTVEIVYLDGDGNEIGSKAVAASDLTAEHGFWATDEATADAPMVRPNLIWSTERDDDDHAVPWVVLADRFAERLRELSDPIVNDYFGLSVE